MANQGLSKAYWSPDMHKIWVEVYVDIARKYGRVGGGIFKEGHAQFAKIFLDKSKANFQKFQMKNRWDYVKECWKAWKVLISKPELGWNPKLRTFEATPEQWKEYCKLNKHANQFRTKPLEFEEQLDIIFGGIGSAGEGMMSPNATPSINEQDVDLKIDDEDDEDEVGEIGSTPTTPIAPIDSPCDLREVRQNKRRKECEPSSSTSLKTRKNELLDASELSECIRTLCANISKEIEKKKDGPKDPVDTSIIACIDKLGEVPGLDRGGQVFMFAVDSLFRLSECRETFIGLMRLDTQLAHKWMKLKYEQEHGPRNVDSGCNGGGDDDISPL